ncbi:MAG: leucyl/phenylalanyl-tRNA--protein transferase [Nitriliruptoraceae bacterium]
MRYRPPGRGSRTGDLTRLLPTPSDGRTRPPRPVAPSAWQLPDPEPHDLEGVVGVGADLEPSTLVDAYRRGIFPWPHEDIPLPWFSPDPRGILAVDAVHVSRSLARTLRRSGWTTTVDQSFEEVVAACAHRPEDDGTWIVPSMQRAYARLHRLGWAHSIEVWDVDALVGGIYGVQIGAIFTGESMFHRETDASKVALLDLCQRFEEAGGALVDVQVTTPHLASLGAEDVPRATFLTRVAELRDREVRMLRAAAPVMRLLGDGSGNR